MGWTPVTYEAAELARELIEEDVQVMGTKLAPIFNNQPGPVILHACSEAILCLGAQDAEHREAIAVKLRCLAVVIQHMPPGELDMAGCQAWLESPEARALQERILQGGGHGQ